MTNEDMIGQDRAPARRAHEIGAVYCGAVIGRFALELARGETPHRAPGRALRCGAIFERNRYSAGDHSSVPNPLRFCSRLAWMAFSFVI